MRTLRLVTNIIWRTAVYGLRAGASVGGAYGMLFMMVYFLVVLFESGEAGIPLGLPVVLGIGLIFGILFGAILGLPLGLVNGVLIALITRIYFYPPHNFRGYRRTIGFTAGGMSVIGGLVILPPLLSWVFWSTVTDSKTLDFLIVTTIPALLAGAAGWWISQQIARWYEREATGSPAPAIEGVPPSPSGTSAKQ